MILHMPMDPATGPFAWHPELPVEELGKRLDAAFNAVPYTAGLNNHMGSRMTAQPAAMTWLMGELQRRHKFFVDSRTSAQTVAAAEAQKSAWLMSRGMFSLMTNAPKPLSPRSCRPLSSWPTNRARP